MKLRNLLIAAGVAALLVGTQFALADCGSCPGDKAEVKAACPAGEVKKECAKGDDAAKCDEAKAACPAGEAKKECTAPGAKAEEDDCCKNEGDKPAEEVTPPAPK